MVIEAISEMDLSPADDTLINRLLVTAFDDSFGDRSYFQQRHHLRLVQRSGAEIIGHIALCYRSVRLGDALVPIIGLADVATAPSMRGQGVASALLKEAIKIVQSSQAQFFLLFGNRPIYAGHGFVSAGNPVTFTALTDAHTGAVTTTPTSALMVMPLREMTWDASASVDLLGFSF